MAIQLTKADSFELRGAAHITYDLRTGRLHYRGPTRPPQRDFVEVSEVSLPLETPIGSLVTVTLREAQDGDTSTVSILLPDVNLARAGEDQAPVEADFETVTIYTTSQSTIGGPGLVEGPIQLYTQVPMEGTARLGSSACSCQFSATLNRELPGPDTRPGVLRVEGECTFGTTGYKVLLVRHEPQGINPRDLLLQLVVIPPGPDDIVAPAFTQYEVVYEEETTAYYETVTILPDGPSIEVEIIT